MNSAEKIWWMKLIISLAVAGLTLTVQISLGVGGSTSFMLGVLIYLGLSNIISNLLGVDRMRGLKIGIGAYFFTWIMTWTLLNTAFTSP